MPNITLRLTDEQHSELRQEAADSMRSIQAEIIYRLFVEQPARVALDDSADGYQVELSGAAVAHAPEIAEALRAAGDTEAAAEVERHFKPDPKPRKK
jgi:thiamine monophosphate synthase